MKKIVCLFIRKFFSYLLTLFLLVSAIFILLRLTPGDPAAKYISPELNSELAGKVRDSFHLNDSVITQYAAFLKNIITGNLGVSYEYHRPVINVISDFLPFTVIFALISFTLQFILGINWALFTVKMKKGVFKKLNDVAALAVYSLPVFLIGIFLIYIFSLTFDLLPSGDLYSTGFDSKNLGGKIIEICIHSILPLVTLSLPGIVIFYRYTKENIEGLRQKNFICYLISNGVPEKEIFNKHILPNILPQLISVSTVELSLLLSGALITERLFNLPGMARITILAIEQRDYPLIVGTTLVAGVFVLVCSLAGEIIRGLIDKRLMREVFS